MGFDSCPNKSIPKLRITYPADCPVEHVSRITNHDSQERMVEGLREKGGQAIAFDFAIQVRQDHFRVAAEFPQDLAARAAGRGEPIGIRDDGDGVESAFAL